MLCLPLVLPSAIRQAANETVRNARITVTIEADVVGTDGTVLPVSQTWRYGFQDGTGQNQIGTVYQDLDGSLATTTATLDVDGATNFQGAAMSDNTQMKFLAVKHEGDTGNLKIGGGDFSSWLGDATDKVIIGPRGLFLLISPLDGYTITASTGDGLLFESTATVPYKVVAGFDNT